ncbi:MAG TPA: carboxymuconolactone decarboxylase family protein [Phycisphaerae bacterium]|nr:carboxymuconolactone decarboxylase family protein [Phycisphaerae bacterium]
MENDVGRFFEQWSADQDAMRQLAPDVLRGFGGMFQAVMKEGALSIREKELIALAIGLAVRCVPCINLHVQKCLHAGATSEQVLEAAGVAVMMQGGPSFTHLPEVIRAIEHCKRSSGKDTTASQ